MMMVRHYWIMSVGIMSVCCVAAMRSCPWMKRVVVVIRWDDHGMRHVHRVVVGVVWRQTKVCRNWNMNYLHFRGCRRWI